MRKIRERITDCAHHADLFSALTPGREYQEMGVRTSHLGGCLPQGGDNEPCLTC